MFAFRVTKQQAKKHYEDGGEVLVSEHGHLEKIRLNDHTTTHSLRRGMGWDELAAHVSMWMNRYPSQRYYIITD